MLHRLNALITSPVLRRRLIVAGLLVLGVWIGFLDSHSILKRVQYAQERSSLQAEVEQLRQANEELEVRISRGLTDEVVEEVAREDYGMRRAGETVYPVEIPGD